MKTSNKVDFSKIVAVSGAGQQHGSVYWKEGSEKLLSTLQGDKTLYEQFNANETFSVSNSPIWMLVHPEINALSYRRTERKKTPKYSLLSRSQPFFFGDSSPRFGVAIVAPQKQGGRTGLNNWVRGKKR